MQNNEILQEFIFDCRMRKLSERTVKGYKNNNLALFRYISTEYGIDELEETNHVVIKGYIEFLTNKGLSETYINSNLKISDIRNTYINILGKGKKIRHVPITATINKYLLRYLRIRKEYIKDKHNYDTEYLLLSQKGKKLTVEAVERVVLNCGINCNVREEIRISPHTCRHYYAQSQLKNGCDLFIVSRLLGHSKIDVTKRYLLSMERDDTLLLGAKNRPLTNL
jgi:site-specific recombinase XerD